MQVFTNDVIMDTLYEYVSIGSWIVITQSNPQLAASYRRMMLRNYGDSAAAVSGAVDEPAPAGAVDEPAPAGAVDGPALLGSSLVSSTLCSRE